MASKHVHEFTDKNFETQVLQSALPVLVDFTATWCGPCKALAPIVEKVAEEFEGKAKVGKLDVDAFPEVAAKYGIRGVPTLIVFRDGKKVDQHVGLAHRDRIAKLLGL